MNRRICLSFAIYLAVAQSVSLAQSDTHVRFFRALNVDAADTVREFLAAGFDPNTPSEKGQLPLYLAMRDRSFRSAAVLLEQPRLQLDATNAVGETALMMAALRGHAHWVQRLLERGAALEREGWTPLHYAASGPGTEATALLLDRGARIDAPSPNGSTALMLAARYAPEETVDLLLTRGANPKQRNQQGLGAADFARLGGRERLAARLDAAER